MSPLLRPVGPFDLELVATLHAGSFEEAWGVQAIGELMAMPGAFGLIVSEPARRGRGRPASCSRVWRPRTARSSPSPSPGAGAAGGSRAR